MKLKVSKIILMIFVFCISILSFSACSKEKLETKGASDPNNSSETKELDRSKYFITVATGPTSGLYYPIGGAFSNVTKKLGYQSSSQATGASAENIQLIRSGGADMAIVMSDAVDQAYKAYGGFEGQEPFENVRALMSLHPNFVQIVTTEKTGITKFEDLKDKKVGIGPPNSGVELNARMMYEAHGMTYEDSKVYYLNYGESIDQMKNGLVDAVFVTSGVPNATIMELSAVAQIVLIPIEGVALKNLQEKYPFFVEATIPTDAYNTKNDTITATVRNIMIIRNDLPEDVVYDITKGIFENIVDIHTSHAVSQKNYSLENSQIGILIPFHPGAKKYYREQGVIK